MSNTATTIDLDADELLHLAWAAGEKGRPDEAMSLLKQAVKAAPQDARCHYLLGAEYAQIGMIDRALDQMGAAVALDPELHAARFQLGLLQLTSRQVEAARSTWSGLDALGPAHSYTLFKNGMLHLASNRFSECISCLQQGISANDFNAPLNADMQRMLDQVKPLGGVSPSSDAVSAQAKETGHLFLNAYTRRLN